MTPMPEPSTTHKECRHEWQPYADADRIWQVCVKCGAEEHVTTHQDQLVQTLSYIFQREDSDA